MLEKNQQITSITTVELLDYIENPDFQLIDVRPIEAYNGWKLKNERRGGHIKGARCLPYKWLNYIDWIEIVRSKKIKSNHSLVIYGYEKSNAEKVTNQLSIF